MNKLITALLLFLIFVSAVYSQSVRTLTLYDAINLAKRNNSDYVIAKLDKLKAEKQVSEVYSENLVPSITFGSRYTRSFRKQTLSFSGQTFEIGSDNSITTTLDVSEPIPFLGTPVFNGIRIAEFYNRIQEENLKSVETKIKSDVKKSFYNVLLLKEVIVLNQQSIDNAQENLRVVEARYRAGVALEYDYIRAKVKVETLKPQLTQSENNLQIAKQFLKNNIGLKDEQNIDVTGSLAYDSLEVWGSTDELIKKISSSNVAIRQLKLSKKINEQLVDIDYANYLPKFYVFGQWSSQANENDGRSLTGYRFYNSIVAGIGVNWDLNLFRNSYKEEQSKIEVLKSEEQIVKTKELLKTQTISVILKIEDAKNRIRSQQEIVNTAQRGYDLATISYKSGVLNQIDVVDAELALSQVKLAYIQAIYDYLIARSELEELLEK
ncbi:MAG: TolC family protein [Ignavibacteria bacterium]|nr:TolC family protein [Ignavibacteria bacterium]